ncbi:MAG TPA: pyruvate kinase [Chloroflexia bacterium]|nr:pyruvate kinase [Chloroflexia bacterium]
MQPRTKIVATIGPASWDEPVLRAMLASGVSVARFNFSHAEHKQTARKIALVRRIANETNLNVAILADLQGPRVRVGVLPPGTELTPGSAVTLDSRAIVYRSGVIPVDYSGLAADVQPGDVILLDEGLMSLAVERAEPELGRIACRVMVGGILTSNKGVNVPNRPLGVPTITEKDRHDLAFAIEHGADMVALSFVRSGADMVEGRRLVAALTGRHIPIIAKIESATAVDNFAEILAEADGVMVARGDMGVEMPPEVLPAIQKRLIAACNLAAKPVITATQMLDSMIRNPRPTRAEATDVANAVLDGTDGIMLSGETATGKFPLEAVQTMARIALEAEKLFDYEGWADKIAGRNDSTGGSLVTHSPGAPASRAEGSSGRAPTSKQEISEIMCQAADRISDRLQARAIIALTRTGTSARLISKYRPRSTLIAVTDNSDTCKSLAVCWGVRVLKLDRYSGTLSTMSAAEQTAIEQGMIDGGDLLVFIGGLGLPFAGQTNLLKVQIAGAPYETPAGVDAEDPHT